MFRNLVDIVRNFGDKNNVRAAGNTGGKSQKSCVSSHDFNCYNSVMRFSRCVNSVKTFARNADSRIKSEGRIRRRKVVVDCLRNSDYRNAESCEISSACERAVSADYYHSVNVVLLYVFNSDIRNVFFYHVSVFVGNKIIKKVVLV